jgi:hypothetical protein
MNIKIILLILIMQSGSTILQNIYKKPDTIIQQENLSFVKVKVSAVKAQQSLLSINIKKI